MRFAATAAAGVVALSTASRGEACDCGEVNGILNSLPENGAQGVPTDVVIWSQGADVQLVEEDGDVVPSRLAVKGGAFCTSSKILTPDAALEPTSAYTLRSVPGSKPLRNGEGAEISFTTGRGPLGGSAPPAPAIP